MNLGFSFKTKDYVLLGILVAMYFVIYMAVTMTLGILVPALSYMLAGQIFSLIGGIIIVFLLFKIPKMWTLTIFSAIFMLLMLLMGMLYLPWLIGTLLGGIFADFIANSSAYKSKLKNALAFGVMQTANILGMLLPIWFFVDYYLQTIETLGNSPEMVSYAIKTFQGWSGILVTTTNFLAGIIGAYLGYLILAKHFKKQEN